MVAYRLHFEKGNLESIAPDREANWESCAFSALISANKSWDLMCAH